MDAATKHDLTIVVVGGVILALLYAQWPSIGGPALAVIGAVIVLGLLSKKPSTT